MNKIWNVISGLSIALIVLYAGTCSYALVTEKILFTVYQQAMMPVIVLITGGLAAFLPKTGESQ